MGDIFISYASADRPQARELGKRLEQEGWSVWWDRKIPPGRSFSKVLEEALNAARCVVVLWSHTSRSSDWVQNEAAEGKRRGILVPGFIEDTSPPFEFRRIQAANLVGWEEQLPGNELDQFIAAIDRVLGGDVTPESASNGSVRENSEQTIPNPLKRSGREDKGQDSPLWRRWGRFGLFFMLMVPTMMGLFKALYPQTPVTEALTTITIFSLLAGAGLNLGWIYWRQFKMKK